MTEENSLEQDLFWEEYQDARRRRNPTGDPVVDTVRDIEILNALSRTSADIDGMVAAFSDVCRRAGEEEKVRGIIRRVWPEEPRILRVIRESAGYASSVDYFLACYDSPRDCCGKILPLLSFFNRMEMTYIVSGTCCGKEDDTVVIEVDPGDTSFSGALYSVTVRGVFTKALLGSGAFVVRVCDDLWDQYLLYGIRMRGGVIEGIPAADLQRTLEEQPDGSRIPLRPNEITKDLPVFA